MFTSWAVVAPGALRTSVVAFEFSRSARHLGVAERLAGVELILIDRALAALLGVRGGGVLVLGAVLAPGVQHTRVVAFVLSRSAQRLGVAERLAGVELVLIDRTLATALGILDGGVLVRRTRAAFPVYSSGAVVCYPLAWDAQRLLQALKLPRICLKLVLRAWLLITIDAKGAAAAIRGFQIATAVALQSRIVVHQPWNQDSR
jgi:hypothetical protein